MAKQYFLFSLWTLLRISRLHLVYAIEKKRIENKDTTLLGSTSFLYRQPPPYFLIFLLETAA